MHGVIIEVKVDPDREQEARDMLDNMVVPRAKTHQGIVTAYWLRDMNGDILRSVQVYRTEENAKETAERIGSQGAPPGAPVTLVSVNTYEVIAHF